MIEIYISFPRAGESRQWSYRASILLIDGRRELIGFGDSPEQAVGRIFKDPKNQEGLSQLGIKVTDRTEE